MLKEIDCVIVPLNSSRWHNTVLILEQKEISGYCESKWSEAFDQLLQRGDDILHANDYLVMRIHIGKEVTRVVLVRPSTLHQLIVVFHIDATFGLIDSGDEP